jgi:protein-disulfide isomerase
MTDNSDDTDVSTERRDLARDKAKVLREQHKKTERRGRLFLRGGIAVAILAIIAIIALMIVNAIRPASAGPLNMLSDGIQIGANSVATTTTALEPGDTPVANVPAEDSEVITIDVYYDYLSQESGQFVTANTEQIQAWLDSGAATYEVHPLSLLNSHSQGTRYSTRAANAAACVANYDPDKFFAYNSALFTDQPADASQGLSDEELLSRAKATGVQSLGSIESCIDDGRFRQWVGEATDRALAGPIPNVADDGISLIVTTPTILVNGLQYTGAPGDTVAFSAFVVQAAGTQFNESSTPTPTPVPTETPAPVETPSSTPTP